MGFENYYNMFSQQTLFFFATLLSYYIYNTDGLQLGPDQLNVLLYPFMKIIVECPPLFY